MQRADRPPARHPVQPRLPGQPEPDPYTSLANLCITPSFLSKLTDTNAEIKDLLRYRVWALYGWHPPGLPVTARPPGYPELTWAPCLPPVPDIRATFEAMTARRLKDRKVMFKNALGAFAWGILGIRK